MVSLSVPFASIWVTVISTLCITWSGYVSTFLKRVPLGPEMHLAGVVGFSFINCILPPYFLSPIRTQSYLFRVGETLNK